MTDCINLKERFGDTYKIATDESYRVETGSSTNNNRDPWNWQIHGSRGHICPWGGELLAVCLNAGHTILANRLLHEPWVLRERSQAGDDGEVNAVFHVDHLEQAAAYIKAWLRRHPQFSEETLEASRKRLQKINLSR